MTWIVPRLNSALAGRYHIERELGGGGMSTVFHAKDLRHDRDVALKVLSPDVAAMLGVKRFLSEIRVTARLHHPHILPLFDSGEAEGNLFYVMPFVEGESLRKYLKRRRQLHIDEALRITKEVASALDHAHGNGIVHRDIKPDNILLQDGTALVTDFGIALAVSRAGGERLTSPGMSLGTPHYMSPEQAGAEKQIDGRTDIYSLGCVLHEMLAGDAPFTGTNTAIVVTRLMVDNPPPLTSKRPSVSREVERAVLIALAKEPRDRFQSAHAFAEALRTGNTPQAQAIRVAPTAAIAGNVNRELRLWQGIAAAAILIAIVSLWLAVK